MRRDPTTTATGSSRDGACRGFAATAGAAARPPKEPPLRIGMLPVARRDTERLRQILAVQRRLMDLESSPRAKRALMHRGPFQEALVWLEIHGRSPEALEHWRGFIEASGALPAPTRAPRKAAAAAGGAAGAAPARRRGGAQRRGDSERRMQRSRLVSFDAGVDADALAVFFSNSCMNSTSASTPSSGNAL